MNRRFPALAAILASLLWASAASASAATNAGDNLRTGWYPDQSTLTPQLLSGGSFGQRFSTPVDGQVYAQPLVSNGTLFVATETDWLYGLDPATGAVRWSRNVGKPFDPSSVACADLTPSIGVTGTPVVDAATGTAYFVAKSMVAGPNSTEVPAWDMHAVDVTTGAERPNFPVRIGGSADNNPATSFAARTQMQRPGLLLMDGVVYAAFGGHCDRAPYQGWVFGVSTAGQVRARWVTTDGANGTGAGIWQAGGGLVSDGSGRIILDTGNGGAPPVGVSGDSPPASLGEAVVRLQVQTDGTLRAAQFFAPYDAATLDDWDADISSGAPVGLPSQYFGTPSHPNLLVQAGKQGYVYLHDRDHLGGIGMGPSGSDKVVARIGPYGGVWARPAVWPGDGGYVYIPTSSGNASVSGSGNLRVYRYGLNGSGDPTISLAATSDDAWGYTSGSPIVTSDGTAGGSGIVWAIWSSGATGGGGQLRAYSAVPSAGKPVLLWSAPIGTAPKFASPGVAGGVVYVGTRDGTVLGFGAPTSPPLTGGNLSFPATETGKSSAPLTATFTATRSVTVTGLSSSNARFALGTPSRTLPAALTAGQTIGVPVAFSPTAAGLAGGTLNVANSSTPVSIGLSGTGTQPAPQLSLSAPALSFQGTRVGGHLVGSVTLANTGGSPLTVQSIGGASAPFSLGGAPAAGAKVAAGDAVTFDVHFDPTAPGDYAATLHVATDGGSGDVGLSGTAAGPPHLEVSPDALDFGSIAPGTSSTASFTVRNSGESGLTIMKSKPPGGGVFTATAALGEGTTLAPGESRTLSVDFRPQDTGAVSDAWLVTGDDGSGVQTVALRGSGAAPTSPSPPPAPPPAGPLEPPGGDPFGAPVLSRLAVVPRPVRAGRRAAAHFRLTRAVAVRIAIQYHRGCARRVHCSPYVDATPPRTVSALSGSNAVPIPARYRGLSLLPGRYRVVARPAGGTTRRVSFGVAR